MDQTSGNSPPPPPPPPEDNSPMDEGEPVPQPEATAFSRQVAGQGTKRKSPFSEAGSSHSSELSIASKKAAKKVKHVPFYMNRIELFDELYTLSQRFRTDSRVMESDSGMVEGEKGAFAKGNLRAGEIAGFYKGQLVYRQAVSHQRLKQMNIRGVPVSSESPCVIWSRDGNTPKFMDDDCYTAWSGVTLSASTVEVGINGKAGGNNLRYINHSETPNIRLMTVINPEHRLEEADAQEMLVLDNNKVSDKSFLLVAVAQRDIDEDEELTFHYKGDEGDDQTRGQDIDFSVARSNIIYCPNKVEIINGKARFYSKSHKHLPADPDGPARLVNQIGQLPEPISSLTLSCAHFEQNASAELIRLADENARNNIDPNHALDGYLLAVLCRNKFSKDGLTSFVRRHGDRPVGGEHWDSESKVYNYLRKRGLLPDDLRIGLMPVSWLGEFGNASDVRDYIATMYRRGDWHNGLVRPLSSWRVKKPHDPENTSWKAEDITRVLREMGYFNNLPDAELEQIMTAVRQQDFGKSPSKSHEWNTLAAYMREGNSKAICAYLEFITEPLSGKECDKTPAEFFAEATQLGRRFYSYHILIEDEGHDIRRNVDRLALYVCKYGSEAQKEKMLRWKRRHDEYLLLKVGDSNAGYIQTYLDKIRTKRDCERIDEHWPGYSERMRREYVVNAIEPDSRGKFDHNKLNKRLNNMKSCCWEPDCRSWRADDFRQYWHESRQWLKDHPFSFPYDEEESEK